MPDKAHLIVPAVTSMEALRSCIEEKETVFSIELALYEELHNCIKKIEGIESYAWEDFPSARVMLCKNKKRFSENDYELFYPALDFSAPTYLSYTRERVEKKKDGAV